MQRIKSLLYTIFFTLYSLLFVKVVYGYSVDLFASVKPHYECKIKDGSLVVTTNMNVILE